MPDAKPGLEEVLRHYELEHPCVRPPVYRCMAADARLADLPQLIAEVVRAAEALRASPDVLPALQVDGLWTTLDNTLFALAEHVEVSR